MSNTCEICDTPDECLSGKFPCGLCGYFVALPDLTTVNKLVDSYDKSLNALRELFRYHASGGHLGDLTLIEPLVREILGAEAQKFELGPNVMHEGTVNQIMDLISGMIQTPVESPHDSRTRDERAAKIQQRNVILDQVRQSIAIRLNETNVEVAFHG